MEIVKTIEIKEFKVTEKAENKKWNGQGSEDYCIQQDANLKIDGLFSVRINKFRFLFVSDPQYDGANKISEWNDES